jgi:sulfite exporter TauE/SafE
MIELLAPIVAASVVGSLHCATMCGGLVAFSVDGSARGAGRLRALASYNGARGLGYVTLGALAGSVGSGIDRAGVGAGVGSVAGLVAGVVMVGFGLAKLFGGARKPGIRAGRPRIDVPVTKLVRRVRERPAVVRSAVVGACTALIPCGWLHAFVIVAAGSATPARGALVMAAFFLGTLPALVGIGLGVQILSASIRGRAGQLSALALVVAGLASLFGRLHAPAPRDPERAPVNASASLLRPQPTCHAE